MKHIITLLLALLIASSANGQIRIVEDFEDSTSLDWTEYADKDVRAVVQMGALELEAMDSEFAVNCTTELPIIPEYDFKVIAKLTIPKIDDENLFGILVDMDEDFNKLAFLFMEGLFVVRHYNNGVIDKSRGEIRQIKLKGGKNRTMELVLTRKGGSYIIEYDNIEVFRWKRALHSPHFGFYTTGKLRVEEMILEQEYTGQQEY